MILFSYVPIVGALALLVTSSNSQQNSYSYGLSSANSIDQTNQYVYQNSIQISATDYDKSVSMSSDNTNTLLSTDASSLSVQNINTQTQSSTDTQSQLIDINDYSQDINKSPSWDSQSVSSSSTNDGLDNNVFNSFIVDSLNSKQTASSQPSENSNQLNTNSYDDLNSFNQVGPTLNNENSNGGSTDSTGIMYTTGEGSDTNSDYSLVGGSYYRSISSQSTVDNLNVDAGITNSDLYGDSESNYMNGVGVNGSPPLGTQSTQNSGGQGDNSYISVNGPQQNSLSGQGTDNSQKSANISPTNTNSNYDFSGSKTPESNSDTVNANGGPSSSTIGTMYPTGETGGTNINNQNTGGSYYGSISSQFPDNSNTGMGVTNSALNGDGSNYMYGFDSYGSPPLGIQSTSNIGEQGDNSYNSANGLQPNSLDSQGNTYPPQQSPNFSTNTNSDYDSYNSYPPGSTLDNYNTNSGYPSSASDTRYPTEETSDTNINYPNTGGAYYGSISTQSPDNSNTGMGYISNDLNGARSNDMNAFGSYSSLPLDTQSTPNSGDQGDNNYNSANGFQKNSLDSQVTAYPQQPPNFPTNTNSDYESYNSKPPGSNLEAENTNGGYPSSASSTMYPTGETSGTMYPTGETSGTMYPTGETTGTNINYQTSGVLYYGSMSSQSLDNSNTGMGVTNSAPTEAESNYMYGFDSYDSPPLGIQITSSSGGQDDNNYNSANRLQQNSLDSQGTTYPPQQPPNFPTNTNSDYDSYNSYPPGSILDNYNSNSGYTSSASGTMYPTGETGDTNINNQNTGGLYYGSISSQSPDNSNTGMGVTNSGLNKDGSNDMNGSYGSPLLGTQGTSNSGGKGDNNYNSANEFPQNLLDSQGDTYPQKSTSSMPMNSNSNYDSNSSTPPGSTLDTESINGGYPSSASGTMYPTGETSGTNINYQSAGGLYYGSMSSQSLDNSNTGMDVMNSGLNGAGSNYKNEFGSYGSPPVDIQSTSSSGGQGDNNYNSANGLQQNSLDFQGNTYPPQQSASSMPTNTNSIDDLNGYNPPGSDLGIENINGGYVDLRTGIVYPEGYIFPPTETSDGTSGISSDSLNINNFNRDFGYPPPSGFAESGNNGNTINMQGVDSSNNNNQGSNSDNYYQSYTQNSQKMGSYLRMDSSNNDQNNGMQDVSYGYNTNYMGQINGNNINQQTAQNNDYGNNGEFQINDNLDGYFNGQNSIDLKPDSLALARNFVSNNEQNNQNQYQYGNMYEYNGVYPSKDIPLEFPYNFLLGNGDTQSGNLNPNDFGYDQSMNNNQVGSLSNSYSSGLSFQANNGFYGMGVTNNDDSNTDAYIDSSKNLNSMNASMYPGTVKDGPNDPYVTPMLMNLGYQGYDQNNQQTDNTQLNEYGYVSSNTNQQSNISSNQVSIGSPGTDGQIPPDQALGPNVNDPSVEARYVYAADGSVIGIVYLPTEDTDQYNSSSESDEFEDDLDQLGDDISQTAGNALNKTGEAINDGYQTTKYLGHALFNSTADVAGDIYDGAKDGVNYVEDGVGDAYGATKDFGNKVINGTGEAIEDGYQTTKYLGHALLNSTADVAGDIYDGAKDGVNYVEDGVGDAYGATKDFGNKVINGTGEAIEDGYQTTKYLGHALLNSTADVAGDVYDGAKDGANYVKDGVGDAYGATKDFGNAIKNGTLEAANNIQDGTSAMYDGAKTVGNDINTNAGQAVDGIANGAASVYNSTKTAGNNMQADTQDFAHDINQNAAAFQEDAF